VVSTYFEQANYVSENTRWTRSQLKDGPTLGLILLLWTSPLSSQVANDDSVFNKIQKRLASSEKLMYHNPIVFVAEVSELGPVYHGVCKGAVSQGVEFTISRLLFGNHPDSLVRTGYINCTGGPLPSPPFTLHARVIVYCEQFHHSVSRPRRVLRRALEEN
jgi:hypothetical protein